MKNVMKNAHDQRKEEVLEGIGESLKRFGGSTELLQKVLDTIPQTVFWKDVALNYLGCNQLFAEHAGMSKPEDLIGLSDFDLPWDHDEAVFYRACDRRIMDSGQAEIGIVESQINSDGELTWLETNKVPLHNDAGEVIGILGTYHDITLRKEAEETLHRINEELERRVEERTRELKMVAECDGLTGLANRSHFVQKLAGVLDTPDDNIALLFLDLDAFKPINDSRGHEAGDQLLTQVAAILRWSLGPGDFAGRFGGDEFVVLLRNVRDQSQVQERLERIRLRLNSDVTIRGQRLMVTASIGIVCCASQRYANCDELINDADLAMYAAKENGKNSYCFFSESMRESSAQKLSLRNDIADGIVGEQFVTYYQPIVRVPDCTISGFEALVRWQHPTHGLVDPAEFIPIAEESGLIIQLGEQVLRAACQQMAQWRSDVPDLAEDLTVTVNLSARQLLEPGYVKALRRTVERYGISPHQLCLEITESLLVADTELAIELLREIRSDGFHLSLDDFGTGYSSLNYLDEFPVDSLKIDRSFVQKLNDQHDNAIVRAILAMAKTLGIEVVAEGVEDEMQIAFLQSVQCDFLQGYYFAEPLPAALATEFLIKSRPVVPRLPVDEKSMPRP